MPSQELVLVSNIIQFCGSNDRLHDMTKRALHRLNPLWLQKLTGRKLDNRIAVWIARNKKKVRELQNEIQNYAVSKGF